MSEQFPEPKSSGGRKKVELNLFNYATKTDLKNATGVDTSEFGEKVDLARLKSNVEKLDIDKLNNVPSGLSSLKSKVDKFDIGKLETTPVDLNKLNNVVKNDVAKKIEHNAEIKSIGYKIPDITNLATKTTVNVKINEIKGEIPSTTNLATTTALNAKIIEVKGKISNTTNFARTTALPVVENKMPYVSNLVKKKLTITQKLMKLKRKLLVMIMINTLLL